jgi:HlyD family secretion protein
MSRTFALTAALLACAATLAAVSAPARAQTTGAAAQTEATPEATPKTTSAAPAITVVAARRAPLVDRARVSGLIEPVERVLVQPLIEGQPIETIEVEVGDVVARGDVLARLSDASLRLQRSQSEASRASAAATIAQAEAQLAEAEAVRDQALRDRDRAVELARQGATSSAAADEARANAATAQARVTAAMQGLNAARAQLSVVEAQIADIELQLSRTAVVAPVAGAVTAREATVGAIASMANEPMFTLVRDGALELRADVAEQDVLRLAEGQAAEIAVVGADAPIAGRVRLVEPTVDDASRLGRVRISIADPARVRSGMFADAVVVVAAREALAIPVSAVREDQAGARVLRVRDGVVEEARVTVGIRDGALVEITSGLAEGEVVVAKAGAFVRPGDRINPVPAPAADAPTN